MSKKISFDLSDFENLNESDEIEVVEESMNDNECKAPEMYKSQYEKIMKSLKKSFKESVEIIEMLEKAKIKDDEEKERKDDEDIEESVDIMDEELFESEGLDLSGFDVDSFSEAVGRDDMLKIHEIRTGLRKKIKKEVKNQKYVFIPFYRWEYDASDKEKRENDLDISTKKQIMGFVYIDPDDVEEFAEKLTEKFKDDLDGFFIDHQQVVKYVGETLFKKFFKKYNKSYRPYALFINKK